VLVIRLKCLQICTISRPGEKNSWIEAQRTCPNNVIRHQSRHCNRCQVREADRKYGTINVSKIEQTTQHNQHQIKSG